MDYEDFKLWVSEKNPEETYRYYANRDCAVYNYLKDRGVDVDLVYGGSYSLMNGENVQLQTNISFELADNDNTYGGLYHRIKDL